MFSKGEYVVYGSKGVCLIQDISHVDIPGVDANRLYYIMQPVQNTRGTVYLPTDNTKAVIRPVMTKDEANEFIDSIPSIAELIVVDEKKREASYKEALKSCSGQAWVSIIKTLRTRQTERLNAGKKITALDERYLKAAEHELYGEMSVSLDIPREDVEGYLKKRVAALA
ncbi:MAG: CarD family transcriptional regulator [Clostridiales bacterium]|nr:CarD family transcriptional regulator [Clostridiales bacterium]